VNRVYGGGCACVCACVRICVSILGLRECAVVVYYSICCSTSVVRAWLRFRSCEMCLFVHLFVTVHVNVFEVL
jgi:hypothetical protein